MKKQQCAHEGCECEVQAGSHYCSTYCEERSGGLKADDMASGCRCGHPGCMMEATAP
jgi:hypothetical protein